MLCDLIGPMSCNFIMILGLYILISFQIQCVVQNENPGLVKYNPNFVSIILGWGEFTGVGIWEWTCGGG